MISEKDSKKTVLVVEDDKFVLKAYRAKFQQAGLEVWLATSVKEAEVFLEREPPGVIVLDLLLPGQDGFEFLSMVRSKVAWQKVPVLVLTNLGQAHHLDRAKKIGVTEYIIKADVNINDLVEKVKKYAFS